MRQRRDRSSPFGQRLFFEASEFEQMMEDVRARAGADGFTEGEGVDVDLVLLRGFDLEADYVQLPDGVLGRTVFDSNGRVQRVEVDRELSNAAEHDRLARRRLRTTLAHEVGHVACHPQLFFEDNSTPSLFGSNPEPERARPKLMCRETGIGSFKYSGEWWEYQANQCMAALLLPRRLFIEKANGALSSLDCTSVEEAVRRDQGEEVLRALANCFDVSFEATWYRLASTGFVPESGQDHLPLQMNP